MNKISTLGPRGTFSDAATMNYMQRADERSEPVYFRSIKSALCAIGEECDLGVIPVENFSEGYVSIVLDHLVAAPLIILGEIYQSVKFSFISKEKDLAAINQLYAQFVAKGQCVDFIASLGEINVINTDSNIYSLEMLRDNSHGCGAIVPAGSFDPADYPTVIEDVGDFSDNQTRFLVLGNADQYPQVSHAAEKTSIIILDHNDYAGLLCEVLKPMAKRGINLTSIVSRPTRKMFGKYYIFIDFIGSLADLKVQEALAEMRKISTVKLLGSYRKIY
ncbi:prephenate dehydratase [Aliamphritea hakodatensis]|uniref:prephenate dehydratase n=1 Tax=Aliamphritea hakodatensis TaxID=2895352 RepID=UPI0022FD5887|nr:prephenate dehydratase domain-containing protein [Aliamphritea hakodatensis]